MLIYPASDIIDNDEGEHIIIQGIGYFKLKILFIICCVPDMEMVLNIIHFHHFRNKVNAFSLRHNHGISLALLNLIFGLFLLSQCL